MLADRVNNLIPSITVELNAKVAALKELGQDIIALNAGESDFNTPLEIVDECKHALDAGKTKYVPSSGIKCLRELICNKLLVENGVVYAPEDIVVTTGAKQALYNAVMAICNPGDEIIIPMPCWVSYVEMIKLAGGVPIMVPTDASYHLDIDAIQLAITNKTKAIIINTPNNPTGAVYSRIVLEKLAQLALSHNLYIISDEIYEKLIYENRLHVCFSSLDESVKDHTILIGGFSKAFAMTGWRLGYSASPSPIAKAMSALQGHITSNSTSFVQWAAMAAFQPGMENHIQQMQMEFGKRRDLIYRCIQRIPNIFCPQPEGAFYIFPDVHTYFGTKAPGGAVIDSAPTLCNYLLEAAKTVVIPGDAFYAPHCIRISYANSQENIQLGMARLQAAFAQLHT